MWWTLAVLVAAVYCLVRGIDDLRQRRYVWGSLGLLSAALLLLTPIQTHAVKLDLPSSPG